MVDTPPINFDTMLQHRLSQSQGQGGNECMYILGGLSGKVDVFKSLSSQGNGFNFDKTFTLMASQGRPKLPDKLFNALKEAAEQCSKINRENMPSSQAVREASQAELFGSGGGMSFASLASAGRSDAGEITVG
jgi:hypothetical protein